METWKHVWRKGLAPLLSTESLELLRQALVCDDARLLQGATTEPPPLTCVADWPCEAGCLVGFCGMADGLQTVGEVEEFFARVSHAIDERMGEPAACRWIYNWWDDTPRDEARSEMLVEVQRTLKERCTEQPVVVLAS